MKNKFLKICALFLCVVSASFSFGACNVVDEVFDIVDDIIGTDNSSNKQSSFDNSDDINSSGEGTSSSVYFYEKTVDYGDYTVTFPIRVVCHVGDTFEINITASHIDTLTYKLSIVSGGNSYFAIDGHSVTALESCSWQIGAKVSELDILYIMFIEVVE